MTDESPVAPCSPPAPPSPPPPALAQSWKSAYPELTFAIVPAENAAGVVDRWSPFLAYLGQTLGTKVTLRVANDYAAVIEGQRSANVQIANYGRRPPSPAPASPM